MRAGQIEWWVLGLCRWGGGGGGTRCVGVGGGFLYGSRRLIRRIYYSKFHCKFSEPAAINVQHFIFNVMFCKSMYTYVKIKYTPIKASGFHKLILRKKGLVHSLISWLRYFSPGDFYRYSKVCTHRYSFPNQYCNLCF